MVVVSYSGREINAKIVYYGPGLSGKTTNLEKIYDSVPESNRGRMVSMKTQTDRTLFFDLLPLDLGELQGMKTRFLLYTVPGQVYYNATRKLVLKGVDALVFVADSSPDKMNENRESLANLEQNLKAYNLDLKTVPWVIQFNKRDLPSAMTVAQMNQELNRYGVPHYEAQAASSVGVFETLRGVSKLLLSRISKEVVERDRGSLSAPPRVAAEEPTKGQVAVEEAPTSTPEPAAPRGKLMQFLKRGKSQEAPAPEAAPMPVMPSAPPMPAPAPLVAEPVGATFTPPASMQPDETVLTGDDLIPIESKSRRGDDTGFTAGELEREASYGSRGVAVSSPSPDTRAITVPIDLGSLPSSGRLKIILEVRLEIEPGPDGKGGRSRGEATMRDLQVVHD
jgi:signal recognition particle receptor subunit beta